MPANVEALYIIGAGLTGTGSGNGDALLSSVGANTLVGLGGSDLFFVNSSGDVVVESAGGGIDTVIATSNYVMPSEVEALYLVGAGLTGIGSGGADSLLSSGGANTMVGLGGDDLYYVNNSGDTVTETGGAGYDIVLAGADYVLPANVEALYMTGAGLTGIGSGGADTLLSTGGANTLAALGGDDLYYVNNSGDTVTETGGAGYDIVLAGANFALPTNVEALYLMGTGLTGMGSGGADTLLSTGGANTLVGLGGDDLFYVNSFGDVVIEGPGGGTDTVIASSSYIMPSDVESLYMVGSGLTGTGNSGDNILLSAGGANNLAGLAGNDLYYVNNTADVVTEAAGDGLDTVLTTVNYVLPANVEALFMSGTGLTGTGNDGA